MEVTARCPYKRRRPLEHDPDSYSAHIIRPALLEDKGETKFQWVINPNGAPAKAQDGSMITFKGSGTFEVGDSDEVTGGGTWSLSTGESGTYRVTSLVKFDPAPGSLPNNPAIRAGLAFLRIAYNDGSRGILSVGCHLPGTPASVAEGIIASKGFVLYCGATQQSSREYPSTPPSAFFNADVYPSNPGPGALVG